MSEQNTIAGKLYEDDPLKSIATKLLKIGKEDVDFFRVKGEFGDEVTLKFDDGKELYVSSAFLKMSSPIFKRMLESDFKEYRTGVIELKDKVSKDFLELLMFLHPAVPKHVTGECLETWLVGPVSAYYVTGWGAPVKCCNRSVPVWQHYNLSHAEDTVFRILPLAEEYDIKSAIADSKTALTTILHSAEQLQNNTLKEETMFIHVDHYKLSKALYKCFEILQFSLTFAHTDMESRAIAVISKFPSWMYIEKSGQPTMLLYSGCYTQYCSLPGTSRVRLLERRLMESEPRNAGTPYDNMAKRNTGTTYSAY